MKRLAFFCIIALAFLPSCNLLDTIVTGNGISKETSIVATGFDSIAADCHLDVFYSQKSGEESITLICDENLVDYYRIQVEGGTLVVGTKPGIINIKSRVKSSLVVNSSEIKSLKVTGSGDIRVTSPLSSDKEISFSVSGSGDINAEGLVECKSFSSSVAGSGEIEVNDVHANEAKLKVTGSGDTDIKSITAENISVSVIGSGDIDLVCKDAGKIDVKISGSGGVSLSGNARSLNSSVTGSGRVQSKNLSLK